MYYCFFIVDVVWYYMIYCWVLGDGMGRILISDINLNIIKLFLNNLYWMLINGDMKFKFK